MGGHTNVNGRSYTLSTGILGATVMPHAIFLHSALTQDRIKVRESSQLRRLFRFEMADVLIAMTVAGLAHACGAAVQLLRVVPTVPTLVSLEATTARLLPSATAALLDITEHKAQEYLEKLAAELQVNPAEVKVAVGRGDPARCIVQTARRIEADLIALATHGKKGATAFWSGSLTPRISGQYRQPLLLVPVHNRA